MLTKEIQKDEAIKSTGFLYWDKNGHRIRQEVKNFLSIGRDSSNLLVLGDTSVSRHHVRIEKETETGPFVIQDMNSRNGLFLNGTRVYKAILTDNDKITLGDFHLYFSFDQYGLSWPLKTKSLNKDWNKELACVPHAAQTDSPILILGPSGTGKEILAQIIHQASKRNQGPLVSVNCSALTESLVESELFGHKKGSFTGSISNRKGAFLSATQGTLFLDEVGDLPLTLQPKFLRAIEYQEIKPVGSDEVFKTDARIISATHQDLNLKSEIREFRQDLFYRLNVVTICIPPLRERMEDFDNLLKNFALVIGVTFSDQAVEVLKSYHWPGNIRELKNMVERARAFFANDVIDKEKACYILSQGKQKSVDKYPFHTLKELEKSTIVKLLKLYKGNQKKVADTLDIPKSTLSDRLKRYKIQASYYKENRV